jgi:Tfp pilus assembly protein PilN
VTAVDRILLSSRYLFYGNTWSGMLETLILLSIFSILNVMLTLFLLSKNKINEKEDRIEILTKHIALHSARFEVLSDNIEMLDSRITYIEKVIEILYASGDGFDGMTH